MRTNVEVQLSFGGRWRSAELTDERQYKHPVIVLQGEHEVRGPAEVLFIRPMVGSERELLDGAKLAGYTLFESHSNQRCAATSA